MVRWDHSFLDQDFSEFLRISQNFWDSSFDGKKYTKKKTNILEKKLHPAPADLHAKHPQGELHLKSGPPLRKILMMGMGQMVKL